MRYFFIKQPSDKKVVGINDGGDQAEIIESKWKDKKELKRYNEEYILGIHKIEERILKGEDVRPPIIEYIKVRPKAIMTDFLSFSEGYPGGRFLVSDKVKDVLASYNVNCRFYTGIGLYYMEKKIENYSNLHLFSLKGEAVVEFTKSIFFNGLKLAGKTLRYVSTFEEYLSLLREGRLVNIEHLSLKSSVIGELDMFSLDIHARIYISERLRKAFEVAGVTGIGYHEPDEPTLEVI